MNPTPSVIVEHVNFVFGLPAITFPIIMVVLFALIALIIHRRDGKKAHGARLGETIGISLLITVPIGMLLTLAVTLAGNAENSGNLRSAFQEEHGITDISTSNQSEELSELHCWKYGTEPASVPVTWVEKDDSFHRGVIYRSSTTDSGCEYWIIDVK